MTALTGPRLRYRVLVVILVCLHHLFTCTLASYDVFFSNYADCERIQPFDLADDDYTLKPIGGDFTHENLVCDMTFKAPSGYGVCLTFGELDITDCAVKIRVYGSSTGSGVAWRVLDCNESKPSPLCTVSRYVTVVVAKDKLNKNKGYNFKIYVEKSNSITEEGVLFASIGVFVGVILGVVALTAILAISILYCCCKHKHGTKKKTAGPREAGHENRNLVQPSAPPVDIDDHQWVADHEGHLYAQYGPYPHGHPPPPYVPPPPYESEDTLLQQGPTNDQKQTCAVIP